MHRLIKKKENIFKKKFFFTIESNVNVKYFHYFISYLSEIIIIAFASIKIRCTVKLFSNDLNLLVLLSKNLQNNSGKIE